MEPKLEGHYMISHDAMVKVSGKPRAAVKLGNEFEKRLSSYVSSAAAAGVGLLAITNSSDAEVVYTPAHIKIPVSDTQTVPLDLNHDGKTDFSFANRSYIGRYGYGRFALTIIAGNSRNQIWGKGGSVSARFASALPAGRTIGAEKSYFQGGKVAQMASVLGYSFQSRTQGQFPYARGRYLGMQFVIEGKIHFGWARLNVPSISHQHGITAVVTGYAYETIPGKPIITGKTKGPDVVTLQPATLGHLATGASAIPAWRVKTAATTH
jgi:hypothetical protein